MGHLHIISAKRVVIFNLSPENSSQSVRKTTRLSSPQLTQQTLHLFVHFWGRWLPALLGPALLNNSTTKLVFGQFQHVIFHHWNHPVHLVVVEKRCCFWNMGNLLGPWMNRKLCTASQKKSEAHQVLERDKPVWFIAHKIFQWLIAFNEMMANPEGWGASKSN